MAMRAKIQFKSRSGKSETRTLRPNQSLIIGSSNAAEIRLADEPGLMATHCEIAMSGKECRVVNLTEGMGSVLVNGTPVALETDLVGESIVAVGTNEILVSIERLGTVDTSASPLGSVDTGSTANGSSSNVTAVSKPPFSPDRATATEETAGDNPLHHEELANGLQLFEIENSEAGRELLKESAVGTSELYAVVNYRIAGKEPGDEDLLEGFPNDVRGKNSLWITDLGKFDDFSDLVETHLKDNCFLLLHPCKPDLDKAAFIKEAKLFFGWWLSPSSFDFSMRNGISLLVEKVFGLVGLSVYFLADKNVWVAITNDESIAKTLGN